MTIKTAVVAVLLGVAAGAILPPVYKAYAAGAGYMTLESCGRLVPTGKHYNFIISGTVDTNGERPRISGTFSVSDPSLPNQTRGMPPAARPFIQCMAGLLRGPGQE